MRNTTSASQEVILIKIAIFGYTDKRIITLSLIKILQATGETLLITDNEAYCRYIEGHHRFGTFSNTHIVVTNAEPENVFEEIEMRESEFQHIIYDCRDTLPDNVEVILYVASNYIDDEEKELMSSLPEPTPIYIVYNSKSRAETFIPGYNMEKVSKKKKRFHLGKDEFERIESYMEHTELDSSLQMNSNNMMVMTPKIIETLEISEGFKIIPSIDSKHLAKVLFNAIGQKLNLSQDLIYGVLKRRWDE